MCESITLVYKLCFYINCKRVSFKLNVRNVYRLTLITSDVKRGQILDAKFKAEDKSLRTRTNLRGQGQGRSFDAEDKFEDRKSCVKQIKLVSVHTTSSKL